jgi:hypothetical protein
MPALRKAGYSFSVVTVNPNDPAQWTRVTRAARKAGLRLIIGGNPEPYRRLPSGRWEITPAGKRLLQYLKGQGSLVLALFVYNEPYWIHPLTNQSDSCGAMPAAELRALRKTIRARWPAAKIYHDLGHPAAWAPGGYLHESHPCIGSKYANQRGVADYVGIWHYPFRAEGYGREEGLATLARESAYVVKSMGAVPVWLNQVHSGVGSLVLPTPEQLLDWNCATRAALPSGSLISWYVWRQSIYSDYLANHPELWPATTQAGCPGTPTPAGPRN